MADDDSAAEFPCKYYSYPAKPKGVCLILKWTVENFSRLKEDREYKFPPVRYLPKCDLEVSLKKSGALFLYVKNKVKNTLNLDSTTTIRDENGKQLYREVIKNFSLESVKDILPKLLIIDDLTSLPNDSLDIDIIFEVFNLKNEIDEKSNTVANGRETEVKLSEDMKNWILAEHPEEISLKTKEGQIPANKAILCARSPVFRKMFNHPTSEQEKNIVHIDDVNGTTLKTLVDFLYSGKTDFPKTELESLKELYYAADKYDVQDLRQICAQNMIPMLTIENVLGILVMAHQHSDDYLKKECMVFIRTCIQETMETESWEQLKASDLALTVEVLETCFKVSSASVQDRSN